MKEDKKKKAKEVWYIVGSIVTMLTCFILAYLIARIPGVIALILFCPIVYLWSKKM